VIIEIVSRSGDLKRLEDSQGDIAALWSTRAAEISNHTIDPARWVT